LRKRGSSRSGAKAGSMRSRASKDQVLWHCSIDRRARHDHHDRVIDLPQLKGVTP
jgi:hypothetical protein